MLESIQNLAFGVATGFYVLATITTLMRIYSRGFVVKSFGWDDWCMLSILFFNSGHQAILYYFIENGAGLHITKVMTENPEHLQNLVFGLFAEEIMYSWMHFTIKTAFLLFYLRFATKTFRKLVYITMGLNTLFTLIIMLIYCLQCLPLDAFFYPQKHPNVKCLNKNTLAFPPAAFSITVDILIVVLPIRSLWAIQVSMRKRIALISIISLGGVVVLISCIRLVVLLEFDPNGSDFTWVLGKLIIISSIELEVAIMAANAPSLKVIFKKWFGVQGGTLRSSATEAKKYGDNSTRSSRGRNEHGYAVNCVPMTDRDLKANSEDLPNRLYHSDSEEQLWKQDSGIIVERSVGVEVSDNSTGERMGRNNSEIRGNSRASSTLRMQQSSTPLIEEEDEGESGRGRKVRDNFEAV